VLAAALTLTFSYIITTKQLQSGALMKRIAARPADGPVVELIYCQPDKALLVARAEGAVRCHNETDPETCPVVTTFEYFDSSSRSTAAAAAAASAAASGDASGNFQHNMLQHIYYQHLSGQSAHSTLLHRAVHLKHACVFVAIAQ
jgi:hypothetical protein